MVLQVVHHKQTFAVNKLFLIFNYIVFEFDYLTKNFVDLSLYKEFNYF